MGESLEPAQCFSSLEARHLQGRDRTSGQTPTQNWGSTLISCKPMRLFLSCDHVNLAYVRMTTMATIKHSTRCFMSG